MQIAPNDTPSITVDLRAVIEAVDRSLGGSVDRARIEQALHDLLTGSSTTHA